MLKIPGFILNLDERTDRLDAFEGNHSSIPWLRWRRIGSNRGENPIFDNKNSHIRALEKGSKVKTDWFLICEDDCIIRRDLTQLFIDELHSQLSLLKRWDIVLLGALYAETMVCSDGTKFIRRVNKFTGMHAYLVNKNSIGRIIMELLAENHYPIDWTLSNAIQHGLACYITVPFIAKLSDSESNITATECNKNILPMISNITEKKLISS